MPPPRRLPLLIATLATAALYQLAFPTTSLTWLAPLALTPLLALAPAHATRRRFYAGWLAGLLIEGGMFRWIPFTLGQMTSLSWPLTWTLWITYSLYHGLRFALFFALAAPVRRAAPRPLALPAVALLFAVIEWLFPVVFPWYLGHAALSFPGGPELAAFQGVPLLSFAVALLSAALAEPFVRPPYTPSNPATRSDAGDDAGSDAGANAGGDAGANAGDDPSATTPSPRSLPPEPPAGPALTATRDAPSSPPDPVKRLRPALLGAGATLLLTLLPALALAPRPTPRSVRVAIVQPNYTLAEKKHLTTSTRHALLNRFIHELRALPPNTFDLVVASEGAFPFYWRLDADDPHAPPDANLDATRALQAALAAGPHTHALVGGLRRDATPAQLATFNDAVHLGPDGRILGHYDKQSLVPFSEYIPLNQYFPALREVRGIGHLTPGTRPCALDVPSADASTPISVACGICYEGMFSSQTREDAGQSQLLVNLTIDTWFGTSTAGPLHLLTHTARAAELGIPLARSALTGISAAIDARGQVQATLPRDVTATLAATLTLYDGPTAFRVVGQLFAPAGLALLILLAVRTRLARRRRHPPFETPP